MIPSHELYLRIDRLLPPFNEYSKIITYVYFTVLKTEEVVKSLNISYLVYKLMEL